MTNFLLLQTLSFNNNHFRLHPKALSTTITTSKRSTSCARAQLQIRTNPVQSDVYCGRSFNSNSGDEADGVVYSKNNCFTYHKVASSRPVYYSFLELFDQRSQYISIKFHLHKPSENLKMCYYPRQATARDFTVSHFMEAGSSYQPEKN